MEQQVGETCCLHTAFVEQSHARVRLTSYMQLDLFFSDYKPQKAPVQATNTLGNNLNSNTAGVKANDSSCSTSDDSTEKQSPRL